MSHTRPQGPQSRPRLAIGLVAIGLAIGVTAGIDVLAPRPAIAQATSASSASASASVAPLAPGVSELRGADIPSERSEPPKPAEWKDARTVRLWPPTCDAVMLREYLRVSCYRRLAVAVVAGDTKDTRVLVDGRMGWDEKRQESLHTTAHLVVPIRRGESLLATFRDSTWRGPYMQTYGTDMNLVVSWRDGDADPLVLLTNTLVATGDF